MPDTASMGVSFSVTPDITVRYCVARNMVFRPASCNAIAVHNEIDNFACLACYVAELFWPEKLAYSNTSGVASCIYISFVSR